MILIEGMKTNCVLVCRTLELLIILKIDKVRRIGCAANVIGCANQVDDGISFNRVFLFKENSFYS